jgi:ribosomal protein S7
MQTKLLNLRSKYKLLRHPSDSLYLSPSVKLLFNKFIRKGKKAFAYKHILTGLTEMRYIVRRPSMQYLFSNLLNELSIPLNILTKYDKKKKGKKKLGIHIPTPFRRLRDVNHPIRIMYKGVMQQTQRLLSQKISHAYRDVAVARKDSQIISQQGKYIRAVYDSRINEKKRFY